MESDRGDEQDVHTAWVSTPLRLVAIQKYVEGYAHGALGVLDARYRQCNKKVVKGS